MLKQLFFVCVYQSDRAMLRYQGVEPQSLHAFLILNFHGWLRVLSTYLTAVLIPVASISCEVFLFEFFSRRIRKP